MVYLNGGKSPDNKQVKKRALHVDIIKGWAMLTIIIFHCSATFFGAGGILRGLPPHH